VHARVVAHRADRAREYDTRNAAERAPRAGRSRVARHTASTQQL
jgi:hypothetical protein